MCDAASKDDPLSFDDCLKRAASFAAPKSNDPDQCQMFRLSLVFRNEEYSFDRILRILSCMVIPSSMGCRPCWVDVHEPRERHLDSDLMMPIVDSYHKSPELRGVSLSVPSDASGPIPIPS